MSKKNGRLNGNGTDVQILEGLKPKSIFVPSVKSNRIKCKNQRQKEFIKMIDNQEIILCSGPAGCGKSHLSIVKALKLIQDEKLNYKKIYVITPTVEITKNGVGFLPGTFESKVELFMNNVYSIFDKLVGKETTQYYINNNIIKVLGLGYIRGENFDDCILIVEESQNITKKEMLTILTRIGENCKMIVSGDLMQIDHFKSVEDSGLYHSIDRLKNIEGIGVFEFTEDDIVRNPIIRQILKNY